MPTAISERAQKHIKKSATVWEKVPVCSQPRDGNGAGRREAIWLTGRDGSTRFLLAGRDGTGSWNGSGAGREIGRVHCREIGREHSRVGTWSSIGREYSRENGLEHSWEIGNVVGIWPGGAVLNGWEHDRERGLETTVE